MKKYIFQVKGMHCKACTLLIEEELRNLGQIKNVKASLNEMNLEISGDFENQSKEELILDINKTLEPHGYKILANEESITPKWSDFKLAVPLSIGFILFFILLQKTGIVNLIKISEVNYGAAFFIGIIASVSTCMAVVGGLVLSMSASFAKKGQRIMPQAIFHLSRLVSFFILGGLIGAMGSVFQIGFWGHALLSLIVGFVMVILGLNLLDLFSWPKSFLPTMPTFIGRRINKLKNLNHSLAPVLLGVLTFFLPCGFTQSMQIYTLSAGNFINGAMLMVVFALGTLPVLALISFGSAGIHNQSNLGIFFKTSGLVVIFFGIMSFINSFVVLGLIPPIFNFL